MERVEEEFKVNYPKILNICSVLGRPIEKENAEFNELKANFIREVRE